MAKLPSADDAREAILNVMRRSNFRPSYALMPNHIMKLVLSQKFNSEEAYKGVGLMVANGELENTDDGRTLLTDKGYEAL